MRCCGMTKRAILIASLVALSASLPGCKRERPAPVPTETAERAPAPPPSITPSETPEPTAAATVAAVAPVPRLDMGALDERRDPDRVLRFYVNALQAGDWAAAARAWGSESGVTATMLEAAYDRAEKPRFELGKGAVEGAAGSLYYEAPVVLRFGGAKAPPERGTLVLRRVNDIDGATREQLRWHIEKSTIGMGQ